MPCKCKTEAHEREKAAGWKGVGAVRSARPDSYSGNSTVRKAERQKALRFVPACIAGSRQRRYQNSNTILSGWFREIKLSVVSSVAKTGKVEGSFTPPYLSKRISRLRSFTPLPCPIVASCGRGSSGAVPVGWPPDSYCPRLTRSAGEYTRTGTGRWPPPAIAAGR